MPFLHCIIIPHRYKVPTPAAQKTKKKFFVCTRNRGRLENPGAPRPAVKKIKHKKCAENTRNGNE